jgi:hypothetical protein
MHNSLDGTCEHNKIINFMRENKTFEQIAVNVLTVNDNSVKQFFYLSVGSLLLRIWALKFRPTSVLETVIYG